MDASEVGRVLLPRSFCEQNASGEHLLVCSGRGVLAPASARASQGPAQEAQVL